MSSGRADYWYRFAAQKFSASIDQTVFIERGLESVAAGASQNLVDYEVPAGYKLIVTGLYVSCDSPGINQFWATFHSFTFGSIYFDLNFVFMGDNTGIYTVAAGQGALLDITNKLDVTAIFTGALYGFLEAV